MIDFSELKKGKKTYAGANGSKISVAYNGERYMLKFPPLPSINKDMSYTNSCISEYIGCHIFEMLGIPVQETLLGTYRVNGKTKLVVACKDFAVNGWTIQDFASLKNQIIESEQHGKGTDLDSILNTIEEQTDINSDELKEFFWNLFIADALIGNWDRHNGNWGFLYNESSDEVVIAPAWDCGSSLYPQADEEIMTKILNDKNEMNSRIYNRPVSALQLNGKKINYLEFISSGINDDCTDALYRITASIDLEKINKFIDGIECLNDLQKIFYKTMLRERKERILDKSIEMIKKNEINDEIDL